MPHIAIISASVRVNRVSHRVALYFKNYILQNNLGSVEILDLKEYNFPVFDERLSHQESPIPSAIDFSERIKKADGVIIVTPEYNGGYPGSLKKMRLTYCILSGVESQLPSPLFLTEYLVEPR